MKFLTLSFAHRKLMSTILLGFITITTFAQNSFTPQEWKGAWGSDGPTNTGDLNGDGKTDVFMWRDASKSWMVNLSTGSGFTMQEWKGAWGSDGQINTGDLNGDGKTDVFMWRFSSKTWMINLSTGSGFTMQEWKGSWGSDGPIRVGDLNGDGRMDVFMWRDASKTWTVNLSIGTGFISQEWKGAWGSDGEINTGDLNGDGYTDVFMWRDASKTWMVNLSTGSGFTMQEWKGTWGSDGQINTGDLNGDGKTDVFIWRDASKTWMVNLSTGAGFTMLEWKGAWGSDGPIRIGDFNGDETTDVMMWRDASRSWMVNLSTGSGFAMQEWKGAAWGSDGPIYSGDLNGDGKKETFMWRDGSKSWMVNISSSAPVSVADFDQDGIPNYIESQLIARFRPFYRFSLDDGEDKYHPTDALWFVKNCDLTGNGRTMLSQQQLFNDPASLLLANGEKDGSADARVSKKQSGYQLDIPNDVRREGEPNWNTIKSKATGLYAHVSPLKSGSQITGYRIEYWQFYAFNDAPLDGYRHEGDWENIRLIVEFNQKTIHEVVMNIHGKDIYFEMSKGKLGSTNGPVQEYEGTDANRPYRGLIELFTDGPAGSGWAQNNLLRLYCENGECTHPIVYIEHSGHASWPTDYWRWTGARKHNGDDRAYLVTSPPNLGEFRHPDPRCKGADLILHFNGGWGSYNDSPPGPALQGWGQ